MTTVVHAFGWLLMVAGFSLAINGDLAGGGLFLSGATLQFLAMLGAFQ